MDVSVIFVISESIVCADHRPHAPNLIFSLLLCFLAYVLTLDNNEKLKLFHCSAYFCYYL